MVYTKVYLVQLSLLFLYLDILNYLNTAIGVGNVYECVHIGFLRRWAASECLKQIEADDQFTDYISIGPVSCATQFVICELKCLRPICRYPR